MEHTLKRKVTVKFGYNDSPSTSRPPSRTNISRPPSPTKSISSQSPLTTPIIRARAKVNTSATPASARKTANSVSNGHVSSSTRSTVSTSSRAGTSASVTPRAASPTKPPPRVRAGAPSPTFQPKARPTVRSHLRPTTPQPQSTSTTPELRHRSLTSASSDVGRFSPASRSRHGSVSLNHAVSFSSLQGSNLSSGSHSPPLRPTDTLAYSDNEGRGSPSIRIKAKVSGLAKSVGDSLSPPSSGPSYTTARVQSRTRAPSTSSSVSMPVTPASAVPPSLYPITTASPAANPHRFATSRASPPQMANYHYQPFQPYDDPHVKHIRLNGVARVDPTTVPLPTTSPPASAVSFSSRSSVSRSSTSHIADSADSHSSAPTQQRNDVIQLRATLDNLVRYTEISSREESYSGDSGHDRETDSELNVAERKVKAEAKSIRKIADLEITNRSLLAINASLETAKHKQAKEIRDLRRKLRESRLILPPRAYRAVKSSLDHDDTADEEDDEDDEINEEPKDGDEVYRRIKVLLEGLLDSGQRALVSKTEDFAEGSKSVAKVLNAEELRTWRDSNGGSVSRHEPRADKDIDSTDDRHHLSPSRIAIPDDDSDDNDFNSEEEVEAMTLTRSSTRSSPAPPPILITESP